MLLNCVLYEDGKKIRDVDLNEASLPGDSNDPGSFVWVALKDPMEDELNLIQRRFNLHELAIEDARNGHQRPKVEELLSSNIAQCSGRW